VSDIAKAIDLARESLYRGGADFNECDLNTLARAVLAMAAVVEAARAWDNQTGGNALRDAEYALSAAVAAFDAEARRG